MPTASCQCGGLTATVAAYYPAEAVTVDGAARVFSRPTASGGSFTQRFCPVCGTTLLWSAAKHPGLIGIAVGGFADPAVPPPLRSVWERGAHPWVTIPTAHEHFPEGRP